MTNGKIWVECGLTAIMVTVAKEFLLTNQISELSLHLGRESNRADVLNSTHVRLAVPWNDTDLLSNNTYYTAQVTLFNSVAPQANRTPGVARILKLPIICTYRKSILTSQHFGDIGYNMIIDPITVSGSFKVIMQLLNGTFPLPHNYTLSPDEDVVVRVTLNTSAEEVKLVISRCWATPTLNPVDIHSYIFLNSSCPLPHSYTSIISNGNASSSSLSVRIFSFVMLDVIYLHCQVQICVEMGSATCVPVRTFTTPPFDCSVRKARLSNTQHKAVGSSGALFRLNGVGFPRRSCVMCDLPIMYFAEIPQEPLDIVHVVGFSVLGITMSLMFLGGLICLFFYQRNRIGNYNFNIKPRQDNFTFHVFNA
ncbi:Uromodulin-like 1 [Merluccius polli]|uniref:Uromodulin-like 1 n=1 Tax=Merluccius polli TaxID=89951 RepID=A0AA47M1Z3_MERPO|nr:Uromodulin-like 1 [Merluccius polli]